MSDTWSYKPIKPLRTQSHSFMKRQRIRRRITLKQPKSVYFGVIAEWYFKANLDIKPT
ncbi:hypothetical protein M434DRAFT_37507 [Hypoxylon sp. CO27-5]|nr:hypothetical protein M434DRAFT_37507 [Hypoxylon sp. CO27-5]